MMAAECGTRLELVARGPDAARGDRGAGRTGLGPVPRGRRRRADRRPGVGSGAGPMIARGPGLPAIAAGPSTARAAGPESVLAAGHRRRAVRLGGILACGPRRQPIRRRAPPRGPCRSCAASPSAPGSPWARWWCWTAAAWPCPPAPSPRTRSPASSNGSIGASMRPAEAAEGDAAEVRDRLGPQYAEILTAHSRMIADPTLHRETRQRRRAGADHGRARRARGARGIRGAAGGATPARTWRPAPRTSATSREGSSGQLIGARPEPIQDGLAAPTIVLAHDLTPSEAAGLDPSRVPGFATEAGGRASHTAIVAAALEIPAVAGPRARCSSGPATAAWPSSTATRAW